MNKVVIFAVLAGFAALAVVIALQNKYYKQSEGGPSVENWAARLVEHIDLSDLTIAIERFAKLVNSGMNPAHAFEVVVGGAR